MVPNYVKGSSVNVSVPLNGVIPDNYCRGCIVVYQRIGDDKKVAWYTHRVIAQPNDVLVYKYSDDSISINGNKILKKKIGFYDFKSSDGLKKVPRYEEINGKLKYTVIIDSELSLGDLDMTESKGSDSYPYLTKDDCKFSANDFTCNIPKGHVFVMGDNRKETLFGFVPIQNIVAFVK
jgi:signal peptidase I